MKCFLIVLSLLFGRLIAYADEASRSYLTIETNDGLKVSVSLQAQTLSFIDSTLITKERSFPISNVCKIYFTETDESTTNIRKETQLVEKDIIGIFDLNGRKVTKDKMGRGIYIVKDKRETYKLVVK